MERGPGSRTQGEHMNINPELLEMGILFGFFALCYLLFT